MNLDFTPAEEAFRGEVRAFVRNRVPPAVRSKMLEGRQVSPRDLVEWQQALHSQGWGAPFWPKEYGGTGWTPVLQYLFEEECAVGGAPVQLPFGLKMVGPVIMTFGTTAQRQRFLPRIISGQDWWCQGYSEPGAGSDLASLKTRAEKQGDHFVVNGQKTWITLAHHANWIFCLVRTDPAAKAQEGISFLLVDMKSQGVTVRPIITMDGRHEVNEVWFDDVRVPVENLVGEENRGWTYAKFLLGHERTNIAGVGGSKRELARLKWIAARERKNGAPLIDDPYFAAKVAEVEIELTALAITNLRMLTAGARASSGAEASLLKIKGSEIQQSLAELMLQAVGPYALPVQLDAFERGDMEALTGPPYAPPLGAHHCKIRKTSIYGGSNEIQRNIIARTLLRM
jgi:alkylation response protein AidB-like acyl-CoA dehydrogenase